MSGVLVSFWSLIAIMGVGYLLARGGITRPGADRALSRIIFAALIPALLFEAVSQADPRGVFSEAALANVLGATVLALLYAVIARYVLGVRGSAVTIGALCASYTNAGNLGAAFLTVIVGEASQVAPILLFQLCVMVPVSFAILDRQTSKTQRNWVRALLGPITNPPVIAVFAGLILALTGWTLPQFLSMPIGMLSDAAIPTMLLAMGISWRGAKMPTFTAESAPLFLAIFLRCIGGPAVVFAFGLMFHLSQHALLAATIAGAFPTANNVFVYAHRYSTSVELARNAVILSTLVSLGVTIVIAALFHI